jgi:hypothetical protein
MAIDTELKGYARDCIRLARLTDDPTIRRPLLRMARGWLEAAAAQASKPPPRMDGGAPKYEGPGEVAAGA